MSELSHRRGPSRGRRRDELDRELAAMDLGRRGLRLVVPAADARSVPERARRLRQSLGRLGPVFSLAGIRLAMRADLLAEEARRELALLVDQAAPAPWSEVRGLVARELGTEPEARLAELEPEPHTSHLLVQWHRGRLPNGERVAVQLLRPELAALLPDDLELLPRLAPAIAPLARPTVRRAMIDGALDDVRRALLREADLLGTAENLERLADAAAPWRVPRVYRATPSLLVCEELGGESLETRADSGMAHNLWLAWIHLVLEAGWVPSDPRPANILVLDDRRIAFRGGRFTSLEPSRQKHLRQYLTAAAAHDPDAACTAVLALLDEPPRDAVSELRRRFRRGMPLRDDPRSIASDHLAEYLLLHWRLVTECGGQPGAALREVYGGLVRLHDAARRLAPEHDALSEAFEEVRLRTELGGLRELFDTEQLGRDLGRYALLTADLPRRLETLLSLAEEGRLRFELRMSRPAEPASPRGDAAAVLAAVGLGVVLLGGWGESSNLVLVLVLGGCLLLVARRG